MNWLDAVIIIGLILFLFTGLKAGLIKMLFLVVGVIIGVTLAGRYSDGLANAMSFIGDPATAGMMLGSDLSFTPQEAAAGAVFTDHGVPANPAKITADNGAKADHRIILS